MGFQTYLTPPFVPISIVVNEMETDCVFTDNNDGTIFVRPNTPTDGWEGSTATYGQIMAKTIFSSPQSLHNFNAAFNHLK